MSWLGIIGCAALALVTLTPASAGEQAPPYAHGLRQMLRITYHKGPSLPFGAQDFGVGIIHNTLVGVGGFCSGQTDVPGKADKYPRGFRKSVIGLDLAHPEKGWAVLPEFPGDVRQGLMAAVVTDKLYLWGGFSYNEPYCYRDGWRLSFEGGAWRWDRLPDLPWPLVVSGIASDGSRIYIVGGSDYDSEAFRTSTDRTGEADRLGARMLVFDTEKQSEGWKELPEVPGTPRFISAVTVLDGYLYVIGGTTGPDNPSGTYCTVVDNWRCHLSTGTWERLANTPIATGNFLPGPITYDNRYIMLVGGYQYSLVMNPDGTTRQPYGKMYAHYPDKPYASDMLVFDTKTLTFGYADPLPLNNNTPCTVVAGNRIHMLGGETRGCTIEGEVFGHHPDLYLIGEIEGVR